MPRHMRRLSKSKIYHVMVRGNERKNIFLDEEDKARYIETLSRIAGHTLCRTETKQGQCPILCEKREKKFYIHAYCLMDNHAHLLINEGEEEISRIMKRIGASYVYYFNKKYDRVGHLYQDRFKSEAIETDSYLLAAVRYIHNNPAKAGIVKNASSYRWSSFSAYIEEGSPRSFIDRDLVLDILSPDRKEAVKLFIEYAEQENMDKFLEHVEVDEEKAILGHREASIYVQDFLREKGISLSKISDKENTGIRNEVITKLKTCSNLSIRGIAELLNINRGVIQRVKA